MEEKAKKRIYPNLPELETTLEVPGYYSLPQISMAPVPNKDPHFNPKSGPMSLPGGSPHSNFPEGNVAQFKPIQKHYRGFLEDYIEKIEEILEKLEDIRKQAESHHYRTNWAKVSGTVVGAGAAIWMGTMWWFPLSWIAIGSGAAMSITGGLTNVITDYVDYKTSTSIMEDVKLLLKEKENFDNWMKKSLGHFDDCIVQLMDEGVSKEVAISTIIQGVAKGAINIMEKPNDKVLSSLSTAVKMHRIEHMAVEAIPYIGKTFHMTEKTWQFVYSILGLTGRTSITTLMHEMAKVSSVLSAAFAVADISILIKELTSEHPSVEAIDKVVHDLKDERDSLLELTRILKEVEEHKDGMLEQTMADIQLIVDKQDLLKDFIVVNDDDFIEEGNGEKVTS